jgi:hypothetical protein
MALIVDAEKAEIGRASGAGGREIVEDSVGHLDDVIGDELRTFAGCDFRMLQAALPFINGPAGKVVRSQFRENRFEIHLTIAQRAIPRRALKPALVSTIDALLSRRIEFGIFDMKHFDAIAVTVNKTKVIHALFDEMASVVIDVASSMAADRIKKHVERVAVKDIFSRMNLVAKIDTVLVVNVEDRPPSTSLFGKTFLDESGWSLRIRIKVWPSEGACERNVLGQA